MRQGARWCGAQNLRVTHRAKDGVPRRTSRLGSLAGAALLWVTLPGVISGLALGTAFVTCGPPPAPPPDAGLADAWPEDAWSVEAEPDAGQDAPDAYDGPVLGDPCTDSHDCRPPQMICCANVCREPHLCL